MPLKSFSEIHWDYFLLLEEDLSDIFDYIEPCKDNLNVYGPKLAKLLLSIGSEIDVVFKDLIKVQDPNYLILGKASNSMREYAQYAQLCLQDELDDVKVGFLRSDLSSVPWSEWWEERGGQRIPSQKQLEWWNAYNIVKHERTTNYNLASLRNILDAMAALFTLTASLARAEGKTTGFRIPQILEFCDERYGRVSSYKMVGTTLILSAAPNFDFAIRY